MKKQEGGKSVRTKRTATVVHRKAPTTKRRTTRPSVRRSLQKATAFTTAPVKKVRGAGAARLAENLVLLTLSYLVLLLVFWGAFAGYSMAVWQSSMSRFDEIRSGQVSSAVPEEQAPTVPAEQSTSFSTESVLVIPSVVRDGNISVATGVPLTVTATIPTEYSAVSLVVVDDAGSTTAVDDNMPLYLGDGAVVLHIATSTLQHGQRIHVYAASPEGRGGWTSKRYFIVE